MSWRQKRRAFKAAYRKVIMEEWGKDKSKGVSFSAFCRSYGISRGTLYTWLKNKDHSGKTVVHRADPELKAKALEIYLRYKGTWSAETISMALKGKLSAPTIRKVIAPYRCKRKQSAAPSKANSCDLKTATMPDVVWSVDWTEYKVRGKKLFILLFMDEASRFYLGWYVFSSHPTGKDVAECLRDVLARYEARPFIFKSDRARAFLCSEWLGVLAKNNIIHHKIRPHCPQDQGVIERGMREVKQWLRANEISNGEELAACLDEGMFMLNFLKPKMVLEAATPAKVYFSSANSGCRAKCGETKTNKEGLCIAN
jgi:putative transposase